MTAESGLFFLIIAFFVSLFQAGFLLPFRRWQPLIGHCLYPAAWLQALCISMAFANLITLRLDSDFSVATVVANSNLALPTLYKIVGTWGNHEGSMLLWVLVLSLFGVALSLRSMPENPVLKANTTAVQSVVCCGFLLFILCTSNPFERRYPPTIDGEALNPILQDFALSIHPPLLYLGYVGFSIVFSLAVAALLQKRMDRSWADIAHPWILVSWSCLTIGIGLGSWWAYRVLGWGGFWFWDPVENVSLLPWLSGTALLHSNIVLKKRGHLKQWVLLLAIITFVLSLLGTFLVRSGVLTSVHSFASDPTRGFFILAYIIAVAGGALTLFALRAGTIAAETATEEMALLSREGFIIINNLFLLTACANVLLGTLYPMFMEALYEEKISVGAPYYAITFTPLMIIPLIGAGFTPFMPWGRANLRTILRKIGPALWASAAAMMMVLSAVRQNAAISALGFGLAFWLAVCSVQWVVKQGIRRQSLPVFLGHFGAAILVAGLTGASFWKEDVEASMQQNDKLSIAGYTLTFAGQSTAEDPNYQAHIVNLQVTDAMGQQLVSLSPEYRTYAIRKTATSQAAIYSSAFHDLYAVIGETSSDGNHTAVRVYYRPMIFFVWGGCMMMALGGFAGIVRRIKC